MAYIPGRCWGDIDVSQIECPLKVISNGDNDCQGGLDCVHRYGDVPQCKNHEATSVGLCVSCYEVIVGSLSPVSTVELVSV